MDEFAASFTLCVVAVVWIFLFGCFRPKEYNPYGPDKDRAPKWYPWAQFGGAALMAAPMLIRLFIAAIIG